MDNILFGNKLIEKNKMQQYSDLLVVHKIA